MSTELAHPSLPAGFTRSEELPKPIILPGKQFDGKVSALNKMNYSVTAVELTTEGGKVVRVCDLRGELVNNLKKVRPKSPGDVSRADNAFYQDFYSYVETGAVPKRVSGVSGLVFYSSVGGSKIRSYWLPVHSEKGQEPPMIARIGECGSASQQVAYYRNIFNLKF